MRFRQNASGRWVRDSGGAPPRRRRGWFDESSVRLVDRRWWRVAEILAMLGERQNRADEAVAARIRDRFVVLARHRSIDADGRIVLLASAIRASLADRRRVTEWPEQPAIAAAPPPVNSVPLVSRLAWTDAEARLVLGLGHAELRELVAAGRLRGPVLFEGEAVFLAHEVAANLLRPAGAPIAVQADALVWRRLAPGPEFDLYGRAPDEARAPRVAPEPVREWKVPAESPRPSTPAELRASATWTLEEVAALLGMPAGDVLGLVRRGELPAPTVLGDLQLFEADALRAAVARWTGGG